MSGRELILLFYNNLVRQTSKLCLSCRMKGLDAIISFHDMLEVHNSNPMEYISIRIDNRFNTVSPFYIALNSYEGRGGGFKVQKRE